MVKAALDPPAQSLHKGGYDVVFPEILRKRGVLSVGEQFLLVCDQFPKSFFKIVHKQLSALAGKKL